MITPSIDFSTYTATILKEHMKGTMSVSLLFLNVCWGQESAVDGSKLENLACLFDLLPPYEARPTRENEHPSFPPEGEIKVLWSFFSVNLCLCLDPSLCIILEFNGVPLHKYAPRSIGSMISFIVLAHELGIPFFLKAFHYFVISKVKKFEGWTAIGVCQHIMLQKGTSQKLSCSFNMYFFVFALEDFPLPNKWVDVDPSNARNPVLTVGETKLVEKLTEVCLEIHSFSRLVSD